MRATIWSGYISFILKFSPQIFDGMCSVVVDAAADAAVDAVAIVVVVVSVVFHKENIIYDLSWDII